ncbi:MAG TPA: pyridoxamine 5'-phosphate oxidase family protein [Burkholderiales bacterium]|jgi:nitroimidazol reductase NimA-like FMN-containing flavoprotein (pyridoxamine 5'-phosphate oxidase superfamily)|nr:pyridoxamine 5'-phosphate oxidase family protein [Burkholderiales bacterium]
MDDLQSSRTTLERYPARGHYDFHTISAILDEGFVCHVGFVANGQPYVIPTGYGRSGRTLYFHGSAASRMLKATGAGIPVCVTVTLVDGLVVARSAFNSSMNYRSVVLLGTAEPVPAERKPAALKVISDHILPGGWEAFRPVKASELAQTTVLALEIVEASAKVRDGPPHDDAQDYALPIWAGVIEFPAGSPRIVPDPRLEPGISTPGYVSGYRRRAFAVRFST